MAILSFHLRDFKQDPILAMDMKEAVTFLAKKFLSNFSRKEDEPEESNDSQDLSPVGFLMRAERVTLIKTIN